MEIVWFLVSFVLGALMGLLGMFIVGIFKSARRESEELFPQERLQRVNEDSNRKLRPEEVEEMHRTQRCPFCGEILVGGPEGGVTRNVYCINIPWCDTAFNIGSDPAFTFGEVIGKVPSPGREHILAGIQARNHS